MSNFKMGDKVAMVNMDTGRIIPVKVCFAGKRCVRVNDEFSDKPWQYRFSPKTGVLLDLTTRWPGKADRGMVFITKQVKPAMIHKWG